MTVHAKQPVADATIPEIQTSPTRLWTRGFSVLWAGTVQSVVGDAFLAVGMMWLVLQLTGSPLAASTVLVLQGVPKLLGPFAGAIVDRGNHQMLMVASDLFRGIFLVALYAMYQLNVLEVWHVYVLVVVLSLAELIYDPTVRTVVPRLVPDARLQSANSWLQIGQQTAAIGGAVLAGVVLAIFGAAWALLIDGVTFLVMAALLMLIKIPKHKGHESNMQRGFLKSVVEGLAYIAKTGNVLGLTALAFMLNFVLSPANLVFPIFSEDTLKAGVAGFGYLISALSAGLLLGGIVVGVIGERIAFNQSFIVGLGIMSGSLLVMSLASAITPALIGAVLLGAAVPFIQVPLVSRLQRAVPPQMQGRVFASMDTAITIGAPLGALGAGQLLTFADAAFALRLAAVGVACVLAVWLASLLMSRRRAASDTAGG
jgi:MFS transporter, DHA3 family, macrolide efflux protein